MTADPERSVAIVTPWYPTTRTPYGGAFVQEVVTSVADRCDRIAVYHTDPWTLPADAEQAARVVSAQRRLAPHAFTGFRGAGGAVVHYTPALLPRGVDWAGQARSHAEWLARALGGAPIPEPVVHAHVGIRGGYAALENARPDARVYLTEHASFLADVLAEPAARDLYDEVVARSDRFFVVGGALHQLVAETFPHHAGKIERIANPIDFDVPRKTAGDRIRRWLTIGSLIPRKRVDYLVECLARCREDDPELTLTVVGPGPERSRIAALARSLGVADAVEFRGAVKPAEIPAIMGEHDLFVHASRSETFGVVVVEAVAAGLPVLVTRCGGPEELLYGIEDEAGALYAVDDSPEPFLAAYRDLVDRFPDRLDLDRAREVLRVRYSHEAVADHHERIWFGAAAAREDA